MKLGKFFTSIHTNDIGSSTLLLRSKLKSYTREEKN